jgi:hypothetical protein
MNIDLSGDTIRLLVIVFLAGIVLGALAALLFRRAKGVAWWPFIVILALLSITYFLRRDDFTAMATLALVAITLIYAIFTGRQAETTREALNLQVLLTLVKELSDPEASADRGIVKEVIKPDESIEEVRRLVLQGRAGQSDKGSQAGAAAERTIARFDRIGFFLIGEGKRVKTQPPSWLWTMIREFWDRLGKWVEYRQSNTEDKEFWHEGYGCYFRKLADEANKKGKRIVLPKPTKQ